VLIRGHRNFDPARETPSAKYRPGKKERCCLDRGAAIKDGKARSLTEAAASISALEDGERARPRILSSYRKPHRGRSSLELTVTLVPFVSLWALAAIAVHHGFW
jgi:hypothetical protein